MRIIRHIQVSGSGSKIAFSLRIRTLLQESWIYLQDAEERTEPVLLCSPDDCSGHLAIWSFLLTGSISPLSAMAS